MPHAMIEKTLMWGGSALLTMGGILLSQAGPGDGGSPDADSKPAPAPASAPMDPGMAKAPRKHRAAPKPEPQVVQGVNTGTAGVLLAITGLISTCTPLLTRYMDTQKLKRSLRVTKEEASRAKEEASRAKEESAALAKRVEELESVREEVPANSARIGAVQGQVDAMGEVMRANGWMTPERLRIPPPRPKSTVTIVEDDPSLAAVLTKFFTLHGFAVTHAATIDDAERLVYFQPHWLLLDLKVAGRDGEDLIRLVKDAGLSTRVIVVTGSPDPDRIRAVEAMGPAAVFRKPVDTEELFRFMEDHPKPQPPAAAPEGPIP